MSEAVHDPQSSGSPAKRMPTMPSDLTIEKLPREILIQVIRFVPVAQWPSLESVSSTFRDTVYEAWRAVRKIHLREDLVIARGRGDTETMNLLLEKLALRAPHISDIGGFHPYGLNRDSIDQLARFEKLERIEFDVRTPLSEFERFLKDSASRNKLKELNANRFLLDRSATPAPLFEAFSEREGLAPLKLESLHFNSIVVSGFLSAVDVSRLTSFNVIGSHVTRSLVINFLNRAIKLERLGFGFDCYCDERVPRMHAKEPAPTELVLQWNKKIIRAVGELENLASLTLDINYDFAMLDCGCRKFDDEMVDMVEKCGRRGMLKELSLWKTKRVAIVSQPLTNSIAMALPNLSSLEMNVGGCDGERMLKAQKSLVSLKLYDINRFSNRVIPHSANAHSLKVLDLHYVIPVPQEELLQICAFTQLKELRVSIHNWLNVAVVDHAVLVAWAEAFGSNLETLVISAALCCRITDEGFLPFIKKVPRIQKLGMTSEYITDRSMKEMATRCPHLRHLDVAGCSNITVEGVQAVIDGCKYLKFLDISSTFPSFWRLLKVPKYRKISHKRI